MSRALLQPLVLLMLIAFGGPLCHAGPVVPNGVPVPEPGTLTLLLAGLGVMAVRKALKRS